MVTDIRTEQAVEIHRTARTLQEFIVRALHTRMQISLGDSAHEITLPQFNTLRTLHEQGGVSIRELSEHLQVSAPSASAMVDRLVEMGLAVREHSETDRRAVEVCLTPDAEQKVEAFTAFFLQSIIMLLDRLGPELASQWCTVYNRIREILEEETALMTEQCPEP